jgi:hypothetical protein
LCDADVLAAKDVAEIDFPPFETDPAAAGDGNRLVMKWVRQLVEPAIDPRRSPVDVGGDLHAQRLMRSLAVVLRAEGVKPRLLLQDVRRGRLGRFLLERQVHPLVPAVLLGIGLVAPPGDSDRADQTGPWYLLTCEALATTQEKFAFTVFERAFKEFGLPQVIRTANGVPFASAHALYGLSKLTGWRSQ